MQLTQKSLISLIIAVAMMIGLMVGLVLFQNSQKVYGSVVIGNEYKATTTDATWSTATGQCKDTLTGSKTLGSVVVSKTSNATLFIYDATSTVHSHHATTTLVAMPLTTVGTYTYDVTASRGLCVLVDTTVGVASTTITTRP